jgi:uncharacterized protein DUF4386
MLKLSDGRNFARTLTGLCLIAGPLLYLISIIVGPDVDDDNKVKELANIASHKGAYLTSSILFLVAGLVTIVGMVGLIHVFRGRRVTLGQVAAGLVLLGNTAIVGFYAFSTVEYEMVNVSGLDRDQMARLLDKSQDAASGTPFFVLFLGGIVLGLLLLAFAAWRRKVAPPWGAAAIVLTGVVGFVGEAKGVEIATFVFLLIGFGSIAMTVFGMSDEEWDAPREPAAPATPVEPTATPALPVT